MTVNISRETDVAIAALLGWSNVSFDDRMGRTYGIRPDAPEHAEVPFFSDDIAAAWEVVDLLERRGYWCQINTSFASYSPLATDRYHVGLAFHGVPVIDSGDYIFTATAPTLPLAICRVATQWRDSVTPCR